MRSRLAVIAFSTLLRSYYCLPTRNSINNSPLNNNLLPNSYVLTMCSSFIHSTTRSTTFIDLYWQSLDKITKRVHWSTWCWLKHGTKSNSASFQDNLVSSLRKEWTRTISLKAQCPWKRGAPRLRPKSAQYRGQWWRRRSCIVFQNGHGARKGPKS